MKKVLLFDFDGVLVDSLEITFESTQLLYPEVTREQHRKLFEGNVYEELRKPPFSNFKQNTEIDFSAEYVPRLLKLPLIDGVREVLEELAERYTLIIVSSSINGPIKEFIEQHNAEKYFTQVMGRDTHQSKVKKIKMVFDKYKVGPEDCLFITDTLGDLREANKSGVRGLAVTWGYHERERLIKGNPAICIDQLSEMIPAIDKYFA